MNYQEMSDFEINKAVHKVLLDSGYIKEQFRLDPQDFTDVFKNTWDKNDGDNSVIAVMRYKNGCGYNPFGDSKDYCKSWADAGSIAEEYKIAVAPYKKGDGTIWQSFGPGYENYVQNCDRNPRRAICIVFLMMKGGE